MGDREYNNRENENKTDILSRKINVKPFAVTSPLALNTKERRQSFACNVLANWTKFAGKVYNVSPLNHNFTRFYLKHEILFGAK